MRVLGTAGHVDHGKSTLVEALTGMDPDRLQEEKDRQMTIDLGFAWMTLPSGEGLGIVDVPGHRDFIENMLAGVGGIDAALLVVAADEGVMPQTSEHLDILSLLEVESILIALSRLDLATDQEWVDLVEQEVTDLMRASGYENAPVVRVSAKTGVGLKELVNALEAVLVKATPARISGQPRLPVDRAFTIAGFGTVVTGTLLDGKLARGQEVVLLPEGRRGRIRGLQTHKDAVEEALPGSRVAANVTGIDVGHVARGDVLVSPGSDQPTSMIDVRIRVLPKVILPVRHNSSAKFFSGSAQRMARVRLLRDTPLKGGETGWLQLVLDAPVVVRRGDHFILRRPSPGATLGGGQVADPHPRRRHKRKDAGVVGDLERLLSVSLETVLLATLDGSPPLRLTDAVDRSDLAHAEAGAAFDELLTSGAAVVLNENAGQSDRVVTTARKWMAERDKGLELLEDFHRQFPLRLGMPVEELRGRMGDGARWYIEALLEQGLVEQSGSRIALSVFEVEYSADEQARIDSLLRRFAGNPYGPPTVKECRAAVGEELFSSLIETTQLVKVSDNIVFQADIYDEMLEAVTEHIRVDGQMTVADVRDKFGTSRKYALALMEHLDAVGVTFRDGDVRHLVRG